MQRKMVWMLGLVASLALLGLWGLGQGMTAWASALARPGRQTVPLTPPATWTPSVPAPGRTATPPPPRPTRRPAGTTALPQPWLELEAAPAVVAPGMDVALQVNVVNLGAAPWGGGTVTLEVSDLLRDLRLGPLTGSASWQGRALIWRLEELAPEASAVLELRATVAQEALPDGRIPVWASLVAPATDALTREAAFELPWAPLPAAGR
ncbi:MAG: hypothetical protein V1772_14300 [Chloroflexota bacterium]